MIFKIFFIFILNINIQYIDYINYSFILNRTNLIDVKKMIPDIQLDIRYASTNNFTGMILDGYQASVALLLPETVQALGRVQSKFKEIGLSLKIFDAYRPLRAEYHMMRWAINSGKEHLLTEGYVPDNIYSENRTVCHPSGNTVDITIVNSDGKELDMGTDFDAFTRDSWTINAEGNVLENRLLLKQVMEEEGFKNLYAEWWHYSYPLEPARLKDLVIRNIIPVSFILFKLIIEKSYLFMVEQLQAWKY